MRVLERDERDDRPRPGRERPDRDQRVHRRGAMPCVQNGCPMEVEARPEHDRGRQRGGEPLPAVELERRHHREHHEWHGEHGSDQESRQQPPGLRIVGRNTRLEAGPVPGRLDGVDQVVHGGTALVVVDGRPLGRIVDRGLDALELVQRALDSHRARRAAHPLEGEPDPGGRRCEPFRHAVSIPQGGTFPPSGRAAQRDVQVTLARSRSRTRSPGGSCRRRPGSGPGRRGSPV